MNITSKTKNLRINHEIKASSVRLVVDGTVVGIVPVAQALTQARQKGLDLVEVSPHQSPPVCRLMNYGKHIFDQKKRSQVKKTKVSRVHIKEIKFRLDISDWDYRIKLVKLYKFIEQGYKVKVSVRYAGREIFYKDRGEALIHKIHQDSQEMAKVLQEAKLEGRQMIMVLAPKINR